ncbi:probable peroxisomal acyl-coenzyme A oxidase 1 [Drosophila grimshawi]|uniref:GH21829 n=1 Tax=Drosophila grimshawi TaxID=7222 RepID=B4J7J6_DROGR|nr:probable peroxisomal acyl-coenzyme A oxidase 1 [Drosophila grimshawi]EDW02144.1 GH21829 [Drosophila grimshawi]
MPLPGVDVGEVGKKLAMAVVNQGFLGLKNVRIPRTNKLIKYAKVDRDGIFTASPASRVNYLTMVYTRCLIVNLNSALLLQAATIATRYSAVRRQSPIEPKSSAPLMADGIEQLRLSTGGHGNHIVANLSNIYGNAVAAYTYESENSVLLLQIGRALVKAWASYKQAETLSSSYAYFETSMRLKEFPKWDNSWQCIVRALQYTAAHKTRIAFENLSQLIAAGQSQAVAANNTGIELTRDAEVSSSCNYCLL